MKYRARAARIYLLAALLVSGCDLDLAAESEPGRIAGMITDAANSAPVPNVDLTIRGEAGTTTVRVPNGTYVASGLQPGAYTVSVVAPAGYEVASGTNGSVSVEVVANGTKTVNFQLRRNSQ